MQHGLIASTSALMVSHTHRVLYLENFSLINGSHLNTLLDFEECINILAQAAIFAGIGTRGKTNFDLNLLKNNL